MVYFRFAIKSYTDGCTRLPNSIAVLIQCERDEACRGCTERGLLDIGTVDRVTAKCNVPSSVK